MNFRKKKSGLFNTLDVVIIIIAISLIVSALFNANSKKIHMLFEHSKTCYVTVSAVGSDFTTSDFAIGEKIYFSDGDEVMGTIRSVKNIKEKHYSAINNTLVFDYSDKNIGVLFEIETKIKESQGKRYINSSVFTSPGKKYILHTENVSDFECTVDEVLVVSQ